MTALRIRPLRNTGPLEVRDYGPNGRKLGTLADCYDDSPWELHRGELVEQMASKDIHGILMALIASLFRTHARPGLTVMTDVYCDLSDAEGASLRAPDVALVSGLARPKDDFFRGTPIVAVEIRGTQSKKYLDEKVKLYLEHDWPCTWIVHANRDEIEICEPDKAPVVYRPGSDVPLVPELSKYGLAAVPTAALFDEAELSRYADGWVKAKSYAEGQACGRAAAVLDVLAARGLVISDEDWQCVAECTDAALVGRWLALAATAPDAATFTHGMIAARSTQAR
jgi:hypothetical protein